MADEFELRIVSKIIEAAIWYNLGVDTTWISTQNLENTVESGEIIT